MNWPVLMLLQNIFASVNILQTRWLATHYKNAHFQILAGMFLFTYMVFVAYALLSGQEISTSAFMAYAPQIILTQVAFTAWTTLSFITFKMVDAAIGSLFMTLNLVAVVAIASLTIQETLTNTQLIGAVVLFVSIIIVLVEHLDTAKRHRWEIGLALTIIASLFFGAGITSEKYLLDHIGMPTYSIFGVGLQATMLWILALAYNRKQFSLYKNATFFKNVTLAGFMRAGASLLFVISLVAADNASLIGMLSGLKIIIVAVLAAIILRETQFQRRKILASCVAVAGVAIMMW